MTGCRRLVLTDIHHQVGITIYNVRYKFQTEYKTKIIE